MTENQKAIIGIIIVVIIHAIFITTFHFAQ